MTETLYQLSEAQLLKAELSEEISYVVGPQERLASIAADISRIANQAQVVLPRGVWLLTSGTTGTEKAVLLSHDSLSDAADTVNSHFGLGAQHATLISLSPLHIAGFMMLMRARKRGANVYWFSERWSPERFIEAVEEGGAHNCSLVTTQLYDLVQSAPSLPPCLELIFQGGMAPGSVTSAASEKFTAQVVPTFGMTETCAMFAWGECQGSEIRYQCLPRRTIAVDVHGRLIVEQCPSLCSAVISLSNQQLHLLTLPYLTGDRVEASGDCGFVYRGRVDDAVKIRGCLVSKQELEDQIAAVDSVRDCFVDFIGDERRGVRIDLYLEAQSSTETEHEVKAALESAKIPWHSISLRFVEAFPRLRSGKIDRKALRS